MTISIPSPEDENEPILPGNTILDRLLNQLSAEDREFVLRLMTELGIRANDPMHPLLVALQYYVTILREIPSEMKSAANDALRRVLTTFGTIQREVDESIARIEMEVNRVEGIRQQWGRDANALLPQLSMAFHEAKATATDAYRDEVRRIGETSLQEWTEGLDDTRKFYLADVWKQGLIWASGAIVIAVLAVGGTTYWLGTQQGRASAVKEFGNQDWYDISKAAINRADNKQRLLNCHEDHNPKCTIWIVSPPSQ